MNRIVLAGCALAIPLLAACNTHQSATPVQTVVVVPSTPSVSRTAKPLVSPTRDTYSNFLSVAHGTGLLNNYTDEWLDSTAYQVCTDYNNGRPAGETKAQFIDQEVQYLEGGPMMDPAPAQGLVNAVFTTSLCAHIAHDGQGD